MTASATPENYTTLTDVTAAAARLRLTQSVPTLPIGSGRGRAYRFCDPSLDLQRRRPGDGSRLVFATLQDGLRYIVAPSSSALGRVARAHPVAAVVEQLAGEEPVSAAMAKQGFLNERGRPFNHKSVATMLAA